MRRRTKSHQAKTLRRKFQSTPARSRNRRLFQRLLTAKELEAVLRIDVKTIYKYASEKTVPHVWIGGNVRFPENDIADWIERCTYRPH